MTDCKEIKNDKELTNIMEKVLAENIKLKKENIELRESLKIQKNWTSIREGYLIPILRERYGTGDCLFSCIVTHIGNIVKEYLGVKRLSEITEVNYDFAKDISITLVNTLCNFEWSHLEKLKKVWSRSK